MAENIFIKHMFLNISTQCNLKCEVCYGHLNVCKISNMDMATARHATEFYYNNREVKYNEHYIMFFGGEPLLNFELIPEFLDWFNTTYPDFKCNFFLFTNGILLDKKKADFFISKAIPIFISYDNDKEYFSKTKTGADMHFDNITNIIKYITSINPELIIPYYILHHESLTDFEEFCAQMYIMGIKKIAVTREMFTSWNQSESDYIQSVASSYSESGSLKVFIYPEIAASCTDCYPQNIMVYPDGEVYDLCVVCGSSLYRLGLTQRNSLEVFRMGNIHSDSKILMNIGKKRELIHDSIIKGINSYCPTLSPDLSKLNHLWDF